MCIKTYPRRTKNIEGNEPRGSKMLHGVKELDTKPVNLSSVPELMRQKEKTDSYMLFSDFHIHNTQRESHSKIKMVLQNQKTNTRRVLCYNVILLICEAIS